MIKPWIKMWKNTFNYKGTATRKEYWITLLLNILYMYVFIIPYALIIKVTGISVELAMSIYFITFLL